MGTVHPGVQCSGRNIVDVDVDVDVAVCHPRELLWLRPSRQSPDLIAGHWDLLQRWGAVPRALVWDNESAVGSWRAGRPKLTEEFEALRGTLGIRVIQCRPRDPESKGLVERANGYLETSFLPGRSFASPADFNTQLLAWLDRANARLHRVLGCQPVDRWDADRSAMLKLPPVPLSLGWSESVRLPRDYYIRLDSNDYSVHPWAIGRRVEVRADSETVTVTCAGRVVASHPRCWARRQCVTDPEHRAAPRCCGPRPGSRHRRRPRSSNSRSPTTTRSSA